MEEPEYRVVRLARDDDRSGFDCGNDYINQFFRGDRIVGQSERRVTNTFVFWHNETETMAGFVSLGNGLVSLDDLPNSAKRKFKGYKDVSAAILGMMGVDHRFRGRDLGRGMVAWSVEKAWGREDGIGSPIIVLDALDKGLVDYYKRFGFIPLGRQEHPVHVRMWMPTAP